MKKILSVMLALLVLPSLVNAQTQKQIIRQIEKQIERSIKKQVKRKPGRASKRTLKIVRTGAAEKAAKAMEHKAALARKNWHISQLSLKEHEHRTDAFLRGLLFGGPSLVSFTSYDSLLKQLEAVDAAIAGHTLQVVPAERLSKETRRLNKPMARDLLLKNKAQVINGYALTDDFLEGYYLRRIYPYLSKPSFQADKSGHLYRGIYMTVDELAATLKDGFLTKMNTWSTGAKKGQQMISFSTSTGEAMTYIFQTSGHHPNGIGVVFEVDKDLPGLEYWNDPVLNSTKTIYHCYKDVPANRIRNVYIYGEFGLESLVEILIKAQKGQVKSNQDWVRIFNGGIFGR